MRLPLKLARNIGFHYAKRIEQGNIYLPKLILGKTRQKGWGGLHCRFHTFYKQCCFSIHKNIVE